LKWLIVNCILKILEKRTIIFAELTFVWATRTDLDWNTAQCFLPTQPPHSFRPFWLFVLEAYIHFSAFPTFLIFHFNISLANSLCTLYTLRFQRYATMWKRLWMVPEGVLNLLVMHPLEGRMVEIVFNSRGILDSIVRGNRPISQGCTHILTVLNIARFSWTPVFVLGIWHCQMD
jgi:hypothetical protein